MNIKPSDIKNNTLRLLFIQHRAYIFMGYLVKAQADGLGDLPKAEKTILYIVAGVKAAQTVGLTK